MAWGPAAFAAVALVWIDQSVAPLVLPLAIERAADRADRRRRASSSGCWRRGSRTISSTSSATRSSADAGFVVLGLAVLDPAIWEPARTWLLMFVVARSAFAAWVVALHGGFGTRRLPSSAAGPAVRRSLAVALVAIAVATVGWPGLAAWEARATIATLVPAERPIAALVTIAPLGGDRDLRPDPRDRAARRPSDAIVVAGRGERPAWPVPRPAGRSSAWARPSAAFERVGACARAPRWTSSGSLPAAARPQPDRPIASVVVLVLAGLASSSRPADSASRRPPARYPAVVVRTDGADDVPSSRRRRRTGSGAEPSALRRGRPDSQQPRPTRVSVRARPSRLSSGRPIAGLSPRGRAPSDRSSRS